jgi:hypothetical protein
MSLYGGRDYGEVMIPLPVRRESYKALDHLTENGWEVYAVTLETSPVRLHYANNRPQVLPAEQVRVYHIRRKAEQRVARKVKECPPPLPKKSASRSKSTSRSKRSTRK